MSTAVEKMRFAAGWILVGVALLFVLLAALLWWLLSFISPGLGEKQQRMVFECTIPGIREKLSAHNGCGCGNDVLRTLAESVVPALRGRGERRHKKLCEEVIVPSISDSIWPSRCQLLHALEDKSGDPVYAMVSARDGTTVLVPLPKIRVNGKWKFNERTASSQHSSMLRTVLPHCKQEGKRAVGGR